LRRAHPSEDLDIDSHAIVNLLEEPLARTYPPFIALAECYRR